MLGFLSVVLTSIVAALILNIFGHLCQFLLIFLLGYFKLFRGFPCRSFHSVSLFKFSSVHVC